jgi:hypothetical protein
VFTAGSAPIKVDPNGDFEVEQVYVQRVSPATRVLMMDTNSDQIAQMIQEWMADRGLMK